MKGPTATPKLGGAAIGVGAGGNARAGPLGGTAAGGLVSAAKAGNSGRVAAAMARDGGARNLRGFPYEFPAGVMVFHGFYAFFVVRPFYAFGVIFKAMA